MPSSNLDPSIPTLVIGPNVNSTTQDFLNFHLMFWDWIAKDSKIIVHFDALGITHVESTFLQFEKGDFVAAGQHFQHKTTLLVSGAIPAGFSDLITSNARFVYPAGSGQTLPANELNISISNLWKTPLVANVYEPVTIHEGTEQLYIEVLTVPHKWNKEALEDELGFTDPPAPYTPPCQE